MKIESMRETLLCEVFVVCLTAAMCVSGGFAENVSLSDGGREAQGLWHFSNGAEYPGAAGRMFFDGEGLLHLEFDFSKGGAYVAAYRDLDEPGIVKKVSFRMKKPPQTRLTVRVVDSTEQTFQKSVLYEKGGWWNLEFGLSGWTGHFGGPGDGILRQPVKRIGFLAENGGRNDSGELLVSDLMYVKGTEADLRQAGSQVHTGEYSVTDFGNNSGFGASGNCELAAGVWTVDFSKTETARLSHSLSLMAKPEKLLLKLQSDAAGHVLKVRLGSHFQGFERTVGKLSGGEQTFTVPMPPEGWSHSGGENDGKVRYPLRLTSLVLERGDGPKELARIELGDLRCVTNIRRDKAVTLLGDVEEGRQFGSRRILRAGCTGWNLLDKAILGDFTITVRDWEWKELYERTVGWILPANGMEVTWTRTVTIPAYLNFAEVQFRFDSSGQSIADTTATWTRPMDDEGDPNLMPESPWGMGVYLYRYGDNPTGYARMDAAAAMAQAAGVKWSREEFSWGRMEVRPGEYDFHYYDKVVETATRHGISVYGLLAYWSRWTKPYTEEGIDDFCKWARAVVRRYKGRVKHWEIYNEPNIFFWSGALWRS